MDSTTSSDSNAGQNAEQDVDAQTSMQQLREVVRKFVDERDWQQFHSPKNLSMAMAIEAAELMEHFQWITPDASRELDPESKAAAGEELADVLCYALAIANELDLDLTSTLLKKMEKNRVKYPAAEFRGRYGMDDPNPVSE
jgi:NTP pyrophosphatase (non-canonical NTP hydrolase)